MTKGKQVAFRGTGDTGDSFKRKLKMAVDYKHKTDKVITEKEVVKTFLPDGSSFTMGGFFFDGAECLIYLGDFCDSIRNDYIRSIVRLGITGSLQLNSGHKGSYEGLPVYPVPGNLQKKLCLHGLLKGDEEQ